MKTLSSLGRFIYAIPFFIFGLFHFMNAPAMSGILSGWPIAEAFVYFSGLALILAAVSIVLNIKARLASLLLALLLLIIILVVHVPSVMGGSQEATTSLLKDVALMGAALTYSGILKK
jgi:uncharacterized membrane protein YphA (DoxX/SURF4 family)